jgi:hypothetical protein
MRMGEIGKMVLLKVFSKIYFEFIPLWLYLPLLTTSRLFPYTLAKYVYGLQSDFPWQRCAGALKGGRIMSTRRQQE